MNVAVIGTGYVGLVTGVCLAQMGSSVTCIDIDEDKIRKLQSGQSPIYEDGLEELLQTNLDQKKLNFTSDYKKGLADKDVIVIAVGTPQNNDGSADLSALFAACRAIAKHMDEDTIIVTKSTVPIGTNERIKHNIEQHSPKSMAAKVVSCPEFLRQGSAVHDTFNADRIIIGSEDNDALETVGKLYQPFNIPIVKTDLRSAEMIKYASNAFLATKISFINEFANLCERVGANVDDVSKGIGMDGRIGKHFLKAGAGYGGSCFPKDLSAIISDGRSAGYPMSILESVQYVNDRQSELLADKISKRFGRLNNKTIAVLGLAFKPGTDDMRNAPSIPLIKKMVDAGANIKAFDPAAAKNAINVLPKDIVYAGTIGEALHQASCAVILTDWKDVKEYQPDSFKKYLASPIIFDGRNCFPLEKMKDSGIEYHSIGRPPVYPGNS
ncbi:UDP-glucose/GDP-mannose dehydrogenase family protein [Lentibacillus sp.]|uniref:UDP-glucose dehydrogenase family protein n=1 Tax=Lentibacillus sp. TaxID=1925746 RepID=UPI002B4AF2C5|nr:UDP-glucose/GDP-mannose dehydrogenase family protein [Lentibacillus sp.]HLS09861.1 UDP-glucose/GDP-mannose dehydrogenase family protein [Lentibacillus sp.]